MQIGQLAFDGIQIVSQTVGIVGAGDADVDTGVAAAQIGRGNARMLNRFPAQFEQHTLQMVVECAGNGRGEFNPPASGSQWTTGAVGCPEWTGIRLRDVLKHCGIKPNAVYIGYYGADVHLSGDATKATISRGVPIQKALEDESMLVFAMNGENIPWLNGHPLRVMFGGWPGSTCGKWLKKIVIRDREHDGENLELHGWSPFFRYLGVFRFRPLL